MTGRIHSFQSMGAVDGPGLRCVVFCQGCPARCAYCHNPDTWDFAGGEETTPEALVQKILRYRAYIKNGGITVTGGEPLMQPDFVAELFHGLHELGIHTALDTSGIGDPDGIDKVLSHTDLVLADVKFLNEADYQKYCGISFDRVIAFLNRVRDRDIPMWVRHVVVPGINDTAEDTRALVELLAPYPNLRKIELLPFRKLCLEKYDALKIPFPLRDTPAMTEAGIAELMAELPEHLR